MAATPEPIGDFVAAWRADSIDYATEPFAGRTGFRRVHDTGEVTALRRTLPIAAR